MILAQAFHTLSTVVFVLIAVAAGGIIYVSPSLWQRPLVTAGIVSCAMFAGGIALSVPSYFGMNEVTGTWRDVVPPMMTYVGLAFFVLTVVVGSVRYLMRAKHA